MKLRPIHPGALADIASAVDHLAAARDLLVGAGCPKAAAAARRALKSTGGAMRHAARRTRHATP